MNSTKIKALELYDHLFKEEEVTQDVANLLSMIASLAWTRLGAQIEAEKLRASILEDENK